MVLRSIKVVAHLIFLLVVSGTACLGEAAICKLTLSGLDLGIEEQTGSVVYLSYPATGVILQAPSESAGLLDVAYPIESFAPLRLGSRFSKARLVRGTNALTIIWDQLGPSRSQYSLPQGKVSAEVSIRAADDGRSVILSCRIVNDSASPIPQVLFPDLWGLKPFDGVEKTRLRLGWGASQPFMEPVGLPNSYYYERGWKEYPEGVSFLRWLDYGSLKGGLSIFEKKWNKPGKPLLRSQRCEADPMSLRLCWDHQSQILPGQVWESGEFWLTPHPGGWAKGIEVYRDYVRRVNPPRPLPRRVRDGLGFQTIWMMEEEETDPSKAAFRYKDLPNVARDAIQHGIDELVVWWWCHYFALPVRTRQELGSREDFLEGVREARELGVNVSPWVSIRTLTNNLRERYGGGSQVNWTYHSELVPQFKPSYTKIPDLTGFEPDAGNRRWQEDVVASLTDWINSGVTSWGWDQLRPTPQLIPLMEKLRSLARANDPESTFTGEAPESGIPGSLEHVSQVLDYSWSVASCSDDAGPGPILNVLRSPRFACGIEDSPLDVKKGFCDGLYLNVWPKKPDQANGTAMISAQPAMAAALKKVAALRKQFLPFFVEGTFLEDSVLRDPTLAFVRGYQYGDKLLVIVLNDKTQPQQVVVHSDLDLWLPSTKRYEVTYYNSQGKLVEATKGEGPRWMGVTHPLQPLELAFFVIHG